MSEMLKMNKPDKLPWHPIEELTDKYQGELLLRAPELIDEDCNRLGVGLGYWQDGHNEPSDENGACGEEGVEYGAWLACKWSMTNDEWFQKEVTPTHFLVLA
jgi:hypothetical protein